MTSERSKEYFPTPQVGETISGYLALGDKYEDPPLIALSQKTVSADGNPAGVRDAVIATALQCYAPGVTQIKQRDGKRMQAIADSTLKAGHHTTRQHNYFTWQFVGVSRSVTREVWHQPIFYNTEQQSQRYVMVKEGETNYLLPTGLTPEQKQHYIDSADSMNESYHYLLGALYPKVNERMHKMYPEKGFSVSSTAERLDTKTKKICQEIARYALPIGQHTTYFHTLSHLQLLRMFRASRRGHFSDEARYIIGRMITTVAEDDPTIWAELEEPLPPKEMHYAAVNQDPTPWTRVFDGRLGKRSSLLISFEADARRKIAANMGRMFGSMSQEEAMALLLDPLNNPDVSDVYDVGISDPVTSILRQIHLSFLTKGSHSFDSQRQRHRMTPGAAVPITALFGGYPDYITPMIIREDEELNTHYENMMEQIYNNVNIAMDMGIPREEALMLLPNAHTVRVEETGDLLDWMHRWRLRLCLLAQEEISFVTIDQVQQVVEKLPELKHTLLAPCGLRHRSKKRPRCPEGGRWCGKPVWDWTIEQYRDRLI